MKIKLTCRVVATKFFVLFGIGFLPMWGYCGVKAFSGDDYYGNLLYTVSAFGILCLYHIISVYNQTLTLTENEIILKRGIEKWCIRYEDVKRIVSCTYTSMPPFDKADIFILSSKKTIHFRKNWFDDSESYQLAMSALHRWTPHARIVKNGKGKEVEMFTMISVWKYMCVPALLLIFVAKVLEYVGI